MPQVVLFLLEWAALIVVMLAAWWAFHWLVSNGARRDARRRNQARPYKGGRR